MENTLEVKMVESRPADDQHQESRPTPSGGSTDPHEFLQMRARQRVKRARWRRWKLAGLTLAVSGLLVGALLSRRHEEQAALADVRPSSPAVVLPVELAPVVAPPAAASGATVQNSAAACEQDFSQHQWKMAIDSCTRAFDGSPTAPGALRVAHAHWSHGESASAGKWAARAVELGSTDADALVLIGHSERQAGHPHAARVAYRRYLRRAPHGWHAGKVRSALRQMAARAPSQAVSAAE
jgi:hypothetical protein